MSEKCETTERSDAPSDDDTQRYCDKGCADCQKKSTFLLESELGRFPCQTISEVLSYIEADLQSFDEDDEPLTYEITIIKMSQHEYDTLPEI